MIEGLNEYQQKAKRRADEFAAILEAVMDDLPGDWQLDAYDGDGFPCWRIISEKDSGRQFSAGPYLAASKQRIEFKACGWPSYTDAGGNKQTQYISNLWNPKEALPQCTAAYDRETRLVAKQIERLFPEYDRIYKRLTERATEAQTYEDRTQSGLRRLAEATGNEYKPNGHRGFFMRELPGETVSIDSNSVGDVRVRLDTEEMLEVIALLYRLRQSGSDGSAGQGPLQACPDCGCTDIQTSAWVEVNGCSVINDEGPLDTVWCPQCDNDGNDGDKGKSRYMVEVKEAKPFTQSGPECGHSACSQNYIDTGERQCISTS